MIDQPADPDPRNRRLSSWTDRACLIPLLGVPLAWVISYVVYRWMIRCGGGPLFCCRGRSPLGPVRAVIGSDAFQSDSTVRPMYDVAARFAWHPTLVAFVVVALGSIVASWYLIHRSLDESLDLRENETAWKWNAPIGAVAVLLGLAGWFTFPQWILRDEILTPILTSALGADSAAASAAETVQRLFQALAFLASCFVVGAASAALLTPKKDSKGKIGDETRHLSEQWRRLSFTLYAGAALLVTAVVHQTAFYGWGNAFATAVEESQRAAVRTRLADLDTAKIRLAIARARIVTDTLPPAPAALPPTWTARRDSLRRVAALLAYDVDTVKLAVERDTLAASIRVHRLKATMTRITELVSTAITRGGGLVYTILLAMTYLPGALVLMERARELSQEVKHGENETEKTRADWRAAHGIAFSIGTQWSKFVAVLSPLLASGSAAFLFKFFE